MTTTAVTPSTQQGEECGACHETFPTLAEVFSHRCPAIDELRGRRPVEDVKVTRGDSIDPPERHEASRQARHPRHDRSNQYPGDCVRCGQRVGANKGLLVKDFAASARGAAWGVEHHYGQCPETPAPAPAADPEVPAGPPLTPGQEQLLRDLIAEREVGRTMVADDVVNVLNTLPDPKAGAGAVIDALKTSPRRSAAPAPAAASSHRPNRYAGKCTECGSWVEAEQGWLTKDAAGRWAARHIEGQCPEPEDTPVTVTVTAEQVPSGRYAITSGGDNDLAFYKVDWPTDGPYAGQVFVKLVVGGHADTRVPRKLVAGVLERIAAVGPAEAMSRYGRELGYCGRCGRHLTDEESRAYGLGPKCRNL
jgi:hypothetical protein